MEEEEEAMAAMAEEKLRKPNQQQQDRYRWDDLPRKRRAPEAGSPVRADLQSTDELGGWTRTRFRRFLIR